MELIQYFQSIIEQDKCPVVICNLEHTIIYMNPAAIERYGKSGGAGLIGKSLMECHHAPSQERIERVAAWFRESTEHNMIYTSRNENENKDVYMVALRDGSGKLIGYYEKHEYRNREQDSLYHFKDI